MATTSAVQAPARSTRKLFYRIQEVSKLTGLKPYVLRYWESEFKELAPAKDGSDQRRYRQHDIEVILAIRKLLYEDRFTIAGARKRLREELRRIRGEAETPRPRSSGQTVGAECELKAHQESYPVSGPCQIEMIIMPPQQGEVAEGEAPAHAARSPKMLKLNAVSVEKSGPARPRAAQPRLGQVLRHLRSDVDDLLRLLNA